MTEQVEKPMAQLRAEAVLAQALKKAGGHELLQDRLAGMLRATDNPDGSIDVRVVDALGLTRKNKDGSNMSIHGLVQDAKDNPELARAFDSPAPPPQPEQADDPKRPLTYAEADRLPYDEWQKAYNEGRIGKPEPVEYPRWPTKAERQAANAKAAETPVDEWRKAYREGTLPGTENRSRYHQAKAARG